MSDIEKERSEEIEAMIKAMTLEEKVSLMLHDSMAVERVGIPKYNWWNECLHGVARSGLATVFPQAIALAATFDDKLAQEEADAISTEARAKFNEANRAGLRERLRGLTFWTPNINIFRDPRWGRGMETYGEDPCLTSRMGAAFIRGLQGDDPEHLKVAACAKHFAVHSGPEKLRHVFNAVVSKKDLWETYLPAFKAAVDAGVESVMGAYNRTLNEPCCGSKFLLQDVLRGKWGFKGHVVSDCWAVRDFHEEHKITKSPAESAALAITNGCDLNCGCTYPSAVEAVKNGLLDAEKVDESVRRLLMTRFKLDMFSSYDKGRWASLGKKDIDSAEHRALARKVAEKSFVLLKNKDQLLPLSKKPKRILVMGPASTDVNALLSNYYGVNSRMVTFMEGMVAKSQEMSGVTIDYVQGCLMYGPNTQNGWTVGEVEHVDVVIACFGLDNAMEGEQGESVASHEGDRDYIELPPWQLNYLKAIHERGTPIVLVLTAGSPLAFPPDIADSILYAWYPGEEGGSALADLVFGDAVPSGHLPVTFPAATEDLPPFDDYSMKGRTYRYQEKAPLFPFGFGLSYTTFSFGGITLSQQKISAGGNVDVEVLVENTGSFDADEVVQLYVSKENRKDGEPLCSLRDFKRIRIEAGKQAKVVFSLPASAFESINDDGESILVPGRYLLTAGDCAPVEALEKAGAAQPVTAKIEVV
ncbi:MAG: glycoside hydrolase family 3 C-terminal domain-containing protein [Treponema sp.]|nr:glycoside hydrolase family 3 C-terminal domain-containing protein [Treponema sp.]